MRTLLVASAGGHLSELHELVPRLGLSEPPHWATFDTEQTRSLLEGERVHHLRPTGPRDLGGVLGNAPAAARLLRRHRYEQVVSTGAAVAMSFLPLASARGARCHYIESAARTRAPSLTGRMLERVPGVRLYAQAPGFARPGWHHGGSVFDAFEAEWAPARPVARVVVTVGTMEFSFRRLLTRVKALLDPGATVLWQTGASDISGLGIDASPFLSARALAAAIGEADLVIAHAGVGSALMALDAGRRPVLVPRARDAGEHVDDHQLLIAEELARRGLAVTATPEELTREHLETAAGTLVRRTEPPPFALRG